MSLAKISLKYVQQNWSRSRAVVTDWNDAPLSNVNVIHGDNVIVNLHAAEDPDGDGTYTSLDLTSANALHCIIRADRSLTSEIYGYQTFYNQGYYPSGESLSDGKVTWNVTVGPIEYTVTGVNTDSSGADEYFEIADDYSFQFDVGDEITIEINTYDSSSVVDSSGISANEGVYTVKSVSYDTATNKTRIVVEEDIADSYSDLVLTHNALETADFGDNGRLTGYIECSWVDPDGEPQTLLPAFSTNIHEQLDDNQVGINTGATVTYVTSGDIANFKTQEEIEDIINSLLQAGSNVTLSYDDSAGTLTVSASDTHISVYEDDSSVATDISGINFSTNMNVTSNSDGTVTVSAVDTDTHADIRANDSSVATDVPYLNFGSGLTVTTNSDGSVTIQGSTVSSDTHISVYKNGGDSSAEIQEDVPYIDFGNGFNVTFNSDGGVSIVGTAIGDSSGTDTHLDVYSNGGDSSGEIQFDVPYIDFGSNLDVTFNSDGGVTITGSASGTDTHINALVNDSSVASNIPYINFSTNLDVVVNSDGGITVTASGGGGGTTGITVEDDDVEIDSAVTVLNFGNNLNVTSNSDGSITVNAVVGTTGAEGEVIWIAPSMEFPDDDWDDSSAGYGDIQNADPDEVDGMEVKNFDVNQNEGVVVTAEPVPATASTLYIEMLTRGYSGTEAGTADFDFLGKAIPESGTLEDLGAVSTNNVVTYTADGKWHVNLFEISLDSTNWTQDDTPLIAIVRETEGDSSGSGVIQDDVSLRQVRLYYDTSEDRSAYAVMYDADAFGYPDDDWDDSSAGYGDIDNADPDEVDGLEVKNFAWDNLEGITFKAADVPNNVSNIDVTFWTRGYSGTKAGDAFFDVLGKAVTDGSAIVELETISSLNQVTYTADGKWHKTTVSINLDSTTFSTGDIPILCITRNVDGDSSGSGVILEDVSMFRVLVDYS